jgi:protocatechuate 3,4-dioxygenase beta subunit
MLKAGLAAGVVLYGTRYALAASRACAVAPTQPQTAGPFFKPRTPQRANLREAQDRANLLTVRGTVASCGEPVPNALIEIWHADAGGEYDLKGFRYRGHVICDAKGKYEFSTIVPGEYPGRTRHIHVRIADARGVRLTSQLYFPGNSANRSDFLYRDDLLIGMDVPGGASEMTGGFNFELKAA